MAIGFCANELVLIRISLNSVDRTNAAYHSSQPRLEVSMISGTYEPSKNFKK
jgi:hypothetical protein